jgi:hypothetical protein
MDGDQGVLIVVLSAQFELQLELLHFVIETGQKTVELVVVLALVLALVYELTPGSQLVTVVAKSGKDLQAPLEPTTLAQYRRARLRLLPETWGLHFAIDLGDLLLDTGSLKDTP